MSSDRPAHSLSYREAVLATGRTDRHLRRLVAAGRVATVEQGGRRWLSVSDLLAAGLSLSGPNGQANGDGPTPDTNGGHAPDTSGDVAAELERLRRQLAVAQALADDRLRELDALRSITARALAALPSPPDLGGGRPPDPSPGPRRGWFRRRQRDVRGAVSDPGPPPASAPTGALAQVEVGATAPTSDQAAIGAVAPLAPTPGHAFRPR